MQAQDFPKINLLKETLKDVDHDARPEIGMVISLKTALCKKVAITKQKIALVLNTTGNVRHVCQHRDSRHRLQHLKLQEIGRAHV